MSNFDLNKEFSFKVNPIFTLAENKCVSTLVTIGNFNLLFDCGWNEKFSKNIKTKYEECLKEMKLDAIFISNNSLNYFGALPLIKSFPKNISTKVYATTPIVKLGVYVMIDAYISNLESELNSLDHIQISQISLIETFYNISEINYLQPILLKSELNSEINLNNNDDMLTVISVPSGSSLGGSCWNCSYRLFNFVYAPEYCIDNKIISDPFPYQKLKKINYFITDNKFQNEVPIIRKIIEEDFNKKIKEALEQKKNIFVPTDNVNAMLEMVVKFGKLLDDYNENYAQNRTERPEYKILICSNCSNEIIEGIKSLTEFLGHKMTQQLFSSGDKPIDFENVICIKNLEEYNKEINKINMKYIILASFESLNIGLAYSLLPLLLSDKNLILINIYKEIDSFSNFNNLIKDINYMNSNLFNYKEKKVLERKVLEKKNEENIENENQGNNIDNKINLIREKSSKIGKKILKVKKVPKKKKIKNVNNNAKMVVEKKKLFDMQLVDDYLSFNFTNRIRYTDYGIECSKGELKLMKKNNESINTNYDSTFLNNDKKEAKLELPSFKIPTKLEVKDIKIEVKCEIFFFPLINKIDFMSKKLIIEEINPKDGVILLGFSNQLNEWLKNNNLKCYDLTYNANDIFEKKLKNNIIEFNYTSEDLRNANKFNIDKYNQNIYSFDSLLLSIKTKRDKLIDISIVDNNKFKKLNENNKEKVKIINNENEDNKILTKNNLKLINIKHQLENDSDIRLILVEEKLRNLDKSVEIYINEAGELVLNGEFGEQYFKIKSKINETYFNFNLDK